MRFRDLKQVSISRLVYAWEFLLQNEGGNRILNLNADEVPPLPSVYLVSLNSIQA